MAESSGRYTMNLVWLLFSFRGRLDAAAFTPWWALYAVPVFFAGFPEGTTAGGYLIRGVLALGYFLLTMVPIAAITTKRLRDAGRSLWLALPACLATPFATIALLMVQHDDIRPPLAYAAMAFALALIAGWVFLMEAPGAERANLGGGEQRLAFIRPKFARTPARNERRLDRLCAKPARNSVAPVRPSTTPG